MNILDLELMLMLIDHIKNNLVLELMMLMDWGQPWICIIVVRIITLKYYDNS